MKSSFAVNRSEKLSKFKNQEGSKIEMEKVFKYSLITTFFLNMFGTAVFIPSFQGLRQFCGLPEGGHPLYGWVIGLWIFFFGVAYLWLAFSQTRQSLFVLIAALGKSWFVGLLVIYAFLGEISVETAVSGLPDLTIATIFFVWLFKTRT